MRAWMRMIVTAAMLVLYGHALGNAERELDEAVAEINATFAAARCPKSRVEVPNTAYTFLVLPGTRLVSFRRADGQGSTRRTETIEVSVDRVRFRMAVMNNPRPGLDPEFFLGLDCIDMGHCIGVVEVVGRKINKQLAGRGKFLPLCGLTNAETTRLVGRITGVAETLRSSKAIQ